MLSAHCVLNVENFGSVRLYFGIVEQVFEFLAVVASVGDVEEPGVG